MRNHETRGHQCIYQIFQHSSGLLRWIRVYADDSLLFRETIERLIVQGKRGMKIIRGSVRRGTRELFNTDYQSNLRSGRRSFLVETPDRSWHYLLLVDIPSLFFFRNCGDSYCMPSKVARLFRKCVDVNVGVQKSTCFCH